MNSQGGKNSELTTVKLSHATPGKSGQRTAANRSIEVGGMRSQIVLQLHKRGAGVDASSWGYEAWELTPTQGWSVCTAWVNSAVRG